MTSFSHIHGSLLLPIRIRRVIRHIALQTVFFCLGFVMSGCATIFSRSSSTISISALAADDNTRVRISNRSTSEVVFAGTVPVQTTLPRKNEYTILIEKDGYAPKTIPLTHRINTTTFYNGGLALGFVLLPVLGVLVDYLSGTLYEFEQTELDFTLDPAVASSAGQLLGTPRASKTLRAESETHLMLERLRKIQQSAEQIPQRTTPQKAREK